MSHEVQYPAYPWERVNGVAGPNLGTRSPCRPPMNHDVHRKSYFYTVLFLDNYYPQTPIDPPACQPITKVFDITEDSNTINLKWLDSNKLLVRHNLPLPVTVEMWDHENRPILYCPILAKDVDNITMGDIAVEDGAKKLRNKWTKTIIGTGVAIAALGTAAYAYMKRNDKKAQTNTTTPQTSTTPVINIKQENNMTNPVSTNKDAKNETINKINKTV